MGVLVVFPRKRRRHRVASRASTKPKTAGSASLPVSLRFSEKTKYSSAGIRLRDFHMETADGTTSAKAAAAGLPPSASTISSTEVSTPCEYSHPVTMSTDHRLEIENICELPHIEAMDTVKSISIRLAATQDALELSSAELCRQIHLKPNRWSQYVRGTRLVTLPVADKLCSTYGLTLDWIYRGNRVCLPQALTHKIRIVA